MGLPVALDGEARHRVARHGGRVESAGYDDTGRAVLEAVVPRDALAPLINDLQTLARGGATVDEIDPPAAGPPGGPGRTQPRD